MLAKGQSQGRPRSRRLTTTWPDVVCHPRIRQPRKSGKHRLSSLASDPDVNVSRDLALSRRVLINGTAGDCSIPVHESSRPTDRRPEASLLDVIFGTTLSRNYLRSARRRQSLLRVHDLGTLLPVGSTVQILRARRY